MEKQKKLVTIDTVLYFGNLLSLVIQPIKEGKQNAIIESSTLTLLIKNTEKSQFWLDTFLKNQTEIYIQDILPEWIQKTGQIPNQIRYRKMKKWGACTKKGTLIFNSYLICLPQTLIEYIVCHELIHLLHFNHSRKFYETVATFLPDIKKLEKELKMYVR